MDINNLKIGNTYKFRVRMRVRFSNEFEIKDIIATYKSQDDERMHFIDRLGNGFGIFIKDIISVSSTKVYGTFNGIVLNADNYKTYCYGTASEYKNTDGILFGTAN